MTSNTWGRWFLYAGAALLLAGCSSPPPAAYEPVPEESEIIPPDIDRIASDKLPRVMVIIDEKSLGTIPTAEVEAMASRILLDWQVKVVDQDMVRANIGKSQELLKMAGDERGAASLGQQFGADLVIMGEAVSKPSARRIADSNLRSYQAVVTLRAVRSDNSVTIASVSKDASIIGVDDAAGSSKALKAAGKQALGELIPTAIRAWAKKAGEGQAPIADNVVMTIGGVDQLWKVKAIREQLQKTAGMKNLAQRSYTAGVVIFEFETDSPVEQLAEEIVMKPPEGLKFQALDVSSGKIGLKAMDAK